MPTVNTFSGAVPYQAGLLSGRTSREMYEEEKLREDAREQARNDLEMMKMEQQREMAELQLTFQAEKMNREDLRYEREFTFKEERALEDDALKREYYDILRTEKDLKSEGASTKLVSSLVDDIMDKSRVAEDEDEMSNYLNETLNSLEGQGYDSETIEKVRDGVVHASKASNPNFFKQSVQTPETQRYLREKQTIRDQKQAEKDRRRMIAEFKKIGDPEQQIAFENFTTEQQKAFIKKLKERPYTRIQDRIPERAVIAETLSEFS